MSDEKREALAGLLEHPGWAIFRQMVQQEWGDAGRRFESELDRLADADDAATVSRMRQVSVARREILRLMKWPSEELKKLAEKKEPELTVLSRRGGL